MKVNEVAKMLNVSPLTIRIGLQQGVFPFGAAFKLKDSNKKFKYVIYDEKVREYIGQVAK